MLLSIIIPMYNAEAYISSCLESIYIQNIDSKIYEVIVINDGSKDRSVEIVQKYQEKYTNIKLYNQKNRGLSATRNVGMLYAKGKYIQFVDSDDFLIPNSLLNIVKFAQLEGAEKSFDMITFGITEGYPDRIDIKQGTGECVFKGNGIDYIATHNYNNGVWYYWLNREFSELHHLMFVEGILCEDGIFTLTALLNSNVVAHINSTVYFYAIRPNSITTTMNWERRKKLLEGFVYAIGYFDKMIEQHKDFMGNACLERIVARRDSYVFFLLIRLLRMGDYDKAKNEIGRLQKNGIYPIKHFIGKDYNGSKYRIITALMNNSHLYLALCKINCVRLKACSLFKQLLSQKHELL